MRVSASLWNGCAAKVDHVFVGRAAALRTGALTTDAVALEAGKTADDASILTDQPGHVP